jgi:hypothetical protein
MPRREEYPALGTAPGGLQQCMPPGDFWQLDFGVVAPTFELLSPPVSFSSS